MRRARTIIKVIALLAAGATLNVAVAWVSSFTFQANSRPTVPISVAEAIEVWDIHSQPSWTQDRVTHGSLERSWGTDLNVVHGSGTVEMRGGGRAPAGSVVFAYESGWPVRALRRTSVSAFWHDSRLADPCTCTLSNIPFLNGRHWFPKCPLWPGFAMNTLFYAGVLWVVFCGPFALRRMIRRRRGRCPACAYPIGESPVCTECGAAIQPRGNASRSG